jgi:hypothetical protein
MAYHNFHDTPFQQDGESQPTFPLISMSHEDYPIVGVATNEALQRLVPVLQALPPSLPPFVEVPPAGILLYPASVANALVTSLRTVILRI